MAKETDQPAADLEVAPETPAAQAPAAGEKPAVAPAPESYTIKVNGEERTATAEELVKMAEKSAGADQRFQDAADLRKTAERGIRIDELLTKVAEADTPNTDEVKELAKLMKVPMDAMVDILKPDKTVPKGNRQADEDTTQRPVALEDMDSEVQQLLGVARQQQIDDAGKQIKQTVKDYVDKDTSLGKIVGSISDTEKSEKLKATINDMVFNDVQRKILASGQYGAEMVEESIQRIRTVLTKLGIPGKASEDPVLLGLGPSGMALPADIQADEPIKRISADDDLYESNAGKRLLQKLVKGRRQAATERR